MSKFVIFRFMRFPARFGHSKPFKKFEKRCELFRAPAIGFLAGFWLFRAKVFAVWRGFLSISVGQTAEVSDFAVWRHLN